jgi:hypothetical protein
MNLAFRLLFSERDHNHTLAQNIEKCFIDIDVRLHRGGRKKYFLYSTAYTVPTRRWAGRGVMCK